MQQLALQSIKVLWKRQLKDGAQGGQLAGGREAVCEKIKQFEDDHVTCSGREGIRCLL